MYNMIRSHGFIIDTRGPRFKLIRGVSAQAFDTWLEAVDAAISQIPPEAE